MGINIRKWCLSDAEQLVAIINNLKIQERLRDGIPYPYTLTDAQNFVKSVLASDTNSTYAFAITLDGKLIGSIGVFRQQNIHNKSAEMGYYISEEYWGKGFGSIAIGKTVDYIFSSTDIVRIYAEPFANNLASCRILEKNGFVLEGTLRKNAFKNGKFLDMKMYSILRDDII